MNTIPSATMTPEQRTRFLRVARFLERVVPVQKFSFVNVMHIGAKQPLDALAAGKKRCGTVGCAIGWTPALFPDLVRWDDDGVLQPKGRHMRYVTNMHGFRATSNALFGFDDAVTNYLFVPGLRIDGHSGLKDAARPATVARHMRRWLALQDAATRRAKRAAR